MMELQATYLTLVYLNMLLDYVIRLIDLCCLHGEDLQKISVGLAYWALECLYACISSMHTDFFIDRWMMHEIYLKKSWSMKCFLLTTNDTNGSE